MYIARDKDERLWLYKEKPYKSEIDNVWTINPDVLTDKNGFCNYVYKEVLAWMPIPKFE